MVGIVLGSLCHRVLIYVSSPFESVLDTLLYLVNKESVCTGLFALASDEYGDIAL